MVVNIKKSRDFLDDILRLGEFMNQDSIFFHPIGYDVDGVPAGWLIGTNNAGYPGYHKATKQLVPLHYSASDEYGATMLGRSSLAFTAMPEAPIETPDFQGRKEARIRDAEEKRAREREAKAKKAQNKLIQEFENYLVGLASVENLPSARVIFSESSFGILAGGGFLERKKMLHMTEVMGANRKRPPHVIGPAEKVFARDREIILRKCNLLN